jgi:histidyl-tRNA synthetase
MSKPSIPKGTRDFLPLETVRRQYIFDTIRKSSEKYSYAPIETPAMENLSTLMGKYGEEGDRLIFKILNSGDYLTGANPDALAANDSGKLTSSISEKALRYDLTVPFARYVVMNYNELAFPFKRYQIQPVWRADRPQKGRYREFYQCDADVVGSDSLLYEVELIQLFDEVLSNLGLSDFTIKINNRKILSGIAEVAGVADKIIDITVAIDKLDKIGLDGVMKELREREIPEAAITKLQPLFTMSGSNEERLVQLEGLLKSSEVGMNGIAELRTVFGHINELLLGKARLQLDVTLARGLNYYTGAIFEVAAGGVQIGSICGGGRYDDLTGIFGMKDLSGVGISFGADRIYDVLNELKLFPENLSAGTTVLFLNFGEKESRYALKLLRELRENGISAEIYPDDAKLKKQMKYADAKGVKFVAMAGEDEMSKGEITLKNMKSGEQQKISTAAIIQHLN